MGQRKALAESTANEKSFQTAREDATVDNAFGDSPRPRDRSRQARPACTHSKAKLEKSQLDIDVHCSVPANVEMEGPVLNCVLLALPLQALCPEQVMNRLQIALLQKVNGKMKFCFSL